MAVFLAMFQKFRLIRERNQLSLDLTKITGKVNRIAKNIKNKQKYFTGLMNKIDTDAKNYQQQASIWLKQTYLGAGNGFMPGNFGGANGFIINQLKNMLTGKNAGITTVDAEGKQTVKTPDSTQKKKFEQLINKLATGTYIGDLKDGKLAGIELTDDEAAIFNTARAQANQMQYDMQQYVGFMEQNVSQNITIFADYQKELIEAEQDAVLDPLNYEQTELELEKAYIEDRLARIKEELQAYNDLSKEENREMAPKFGLA